MQKTDTARSPERAPYDVDIAHPFIVAYLLNERNERNEREYYRQQPAYLKLTQLGERTVGERYEEEYEHERIAVVEPVRVLKAVPYKVGQQSDMLIANTVIKPAAASFSLPLGLRAKKNIGMSSSVSEPQAMNGSPRDERCRRRWASSLQRSRAGRIFALMS